MKKSTMQGGALVASKLRKLPKLDTNGQRVAPGVYDWWCRSGPESRERVTVYRRGSQLYVCPAGGVEVRVTANLAGALEPA